MNVDLFPFTYFWISDFYTTGDHYGHDSGVLEGCK